MTKAITEAKDKTPATANDGPLALKAEMVDGTLKISGGKQEHQELVSLLASECPYYNALMLGQLFGVLPKSGEDDADCTVRLRCAVAMLQGFAPQNTAEAMLAVQAVCAHMASVELSRRTIKATAIPQMEANGNLANKFARTFVAQMEGLAKLRRNGKQIVEHVHVNAGGQAVIAGTVHTGGGHG